MRVLLLLGLACSSTTYVVTPDEAAMLTHPEIVGVLRGKDVEPVAEPIGVFGRGKDAYLLTVSGHRPLADGDRIVIREGESESDARTNRVILGVASLVTAGALAVCGPIELAEGNWPKDGPFTKVGQMTAGMVCLITAGVLGVTGIVLLILAATS